MRPPMVPSQTYEVDISLWRTSYVFNVGHRLRLALSSSNSPRFHVRHPSRSTTSSPLAIFCLLPRVPARICYMLCAYALQANPNDRSAVVLNHTGVVARNTIHLGPQTYIELPVVQFSQIPDVWNGTADSAMLV